MSECGQEMRRIPDVLIAGSSWFHAFAELIILSKTRRNWKQFPAISSRSIDHAVLVLLPHVMWWPVDQAASGM
jgi:hypothetical protein